MIDQPARTIEVINHDRAAQFRRDTGHSSTNAFFVEHVFANAGAMYTMQCRLGELSNKVR